jgi:hypothetical protein
MEYRSIKRASVLLAPCFAGLLFSSCQQVVSVDLNKANPQIVIEGVVKDQPGPYSVVLSKTGSYFDTSLVTPPVSDALVIMADDLGHRDTLQETVPGTYETSTIQGVPGNVYSLAVLEGGKEYDAVTFMPVKVAIDSLYATPRRAFDGDRGYDIYVLFKDPPQPGNYYRINVRSSSLISSDSIDGRRYRLFDDKLTNGNEMNVRIRAGKNVSAGDTISIDLLSIDKATYDYFNTLRDILSSDRSPTSLSPANPTTNLSNNALGYFAAYTVDTMSIVIH